MKRCSLFLAVLICAVCGAYFASAQGTTELSDVKLSERLGTISFPTSCSQEVQTSFERGIALLHSFWYEESDKQFAHVAAEDPKCAIAYWGEAMSQWHPLWVHPNDQTLKRGWAFVQQAQAAGANTERERDYIAAAADFYRPGENISLEQRSAIYCAAMKTLYEKYPKDREAAAFYSLSLLASAHPMDASLAKEREALRILQVLFHEQPDHPGAAHYLIHSCDSPQLASQGLEAALRYAKIAPASPHALHMPAHIFARLGMWREDIESNIAALEANEKATAMHMGGAAHELHAMDFLEYAYLQIGQDDKAKAIVSQVTSRNGKDTPNDMQGYRDMARASFPATYFLETRQWKPATELEPNSASKPYNQAAIYRAQAIAFGHLGDAANAWKAVKQYDAMVEATKSNNQGNYDESMDMDGDEARAWATFAEGKKGEALRLLQIIADKQDVVGKGETALPAREFLADMLMEMNRPHEALAAYEKSLKTDPNRFNGLYGAAQAASALRQTRKARAYYSQLLRNCNDAHSDRPELKFARRLITKQH